MNSKKILFVVPDLDAGGVTSALSSAIKVLQDYGNQVSVLNMSSKAINRKTIQAEMLSLDGIAKYWDLGIKNIKSEKSFFKKITLILLGAIKKLTNRKKTWLKIVWRKKCFFQDFDVAIAFKQSTPCFLFVLNHVKAAKKVAFIHGEIEYMGDISAWEKLMPYYDKVAYVSNAVKDGFVSRYPELARNAQVVYNIIDEKEIRQKALDGKKVIDENITCFRILTVSRIQNYLKQTDWIPMICKRLKTLTEKTFCWYVIGDGPDYEIVVKKIEELGVSDCIKLFGHTDNPYPYFLTSDLFVLPSKTESFGIVVAEALTLNVPVIVSDYPAAKEVIDNGKTGIVVSKSIDMFAEQIASLINDNDKYQKLKNNCNSYHYPEHIARRQLLEVIS